MALSIQHLLSATFGPAKRTIVKQAYDSFFQKMPIVLRHVATNLPYSLPAKHANPKTKFFVVHIQIPSEKVKQLQYDIVVQYLTSDRPSKDTLIRCYSNVPSFAFFFAYVFHKWDALLFPQYYGVEFLTEQPKARNPKQVPEADKYLYAAIRYVFYKRLTYDSASKLGMTDWNKSPVKPFQEIFKERQRLGVLESKQHHQRRRGKK